MKFNAISVIFFFACVSGAFGANVRRKREENNPGVSSKIDLLTIDKSPEEIDSSIVSPAEQSSFDELDALELNDNLDQLSSSEMKFLTETSASSKEENLSVALSDDSVSSKDKDSSEDSLTEASTSSESKIFGDDTSESSISSERKNSNEDSSAEASTSSETKNSKEDSSISASTSSETKNSNEDSSISASISSETKNSNEDSSISASASSETKNSGGDSSEQASTSSETKDSSEDSSIKASTSSESKDPNKDSSKHADKSFSSEVRDASDEDSSEIRSHERQTKCHEREVTTQNPTTKQIYLDPKVQGLNIALYFALQNMNRKILFGHELRFESLVKVLALTYKIEKAGGSVIDLNKLMLKTVASFYPQSLKDAMISEDF